MVSAYRPHGGHQDSEVEGVYTEIENLIKIARTNTLKTHYFGMVLECRSVFNTVG